jgi:arylsulfatase A-like enzyme
MLQQKDSAVKKPDIVFFFLDQLAAKWLEIGRAKKIMPTPNIDYLCSQGVSFSQAFSNNPVCCPARATVATGLSTRGHGVLQNGYELDPAIPNFMQSLQKNGWRTGAFGKTHFHAHYHSVYPDDTRYGFDIAFNTEDPRAGEWLDWVEKEHPDYYKEAVASIPDVNLDEYRHYGPKKIDLMEMTKRLKKEIDWHTDTYPHNVPYPHHTLPFPEKISQTAWITSHAIDFIADTPKDQPLFAHIGYVQPHSPFEPPEKFMELVNAGAIPAPIAPEWLEDKQLFELFKDTEEARQRIPDHWRAYRQYYFADIAYLDAKLGDVIDALKKAGRWENTYFIFFADHGELLMDHGFSGKAERQYDACVRVPIIIAGPGIQQNRACDDIVSLLDICPTVFDMAGVAPTPLREMGPYLSSHPPAFAGKSLLPLCTGETKTYARDHVYMEAFNNLRKSSPQEWARTIRTKKWRYTLYPDGGGEQLFNLETDPDETKNLAHDSSYADTRHELRDILLEEVILQDCPHTPRELFSLGVH